MPSELPTTTAMRSAWARFLNDSTVELRELIKRLGVDTFLKSFPDAPPNATTLSDGGDTPESLYAYIQWLKEQAGEHQLLKFAKALVDGGHVRLFVKLLSQPLAVDCSKLEALYAGRSSADASGATFFPFSAIPERVLDEKPGDVVPLEHRDFLFKHAETMRLLVADPRPAINHLHATSTISDSQKIVIDAEHAAGSDWAGKLLYHTVGGEAPSSQRRDRLVHAFLVSGNYRIFNVLKDIADVGRMEFFCHRSDIPAFCRPEDSSKENASTPHYNGHIRTATSAAMEAALEEAPPEPRGLLHDLSVDLPDTNRATDLTYYRDNSADIYPNFTRPKGLALVINNYRFHPSTTLRNRDGTEVDERNICSLLSKLGYHVLPPRRDITAAAMIDAMRWFADHPAQRLAGSCVVVVLTHGEYDETQITYTSDHFTGVDGRKCNLHHFISTLNARNCPALAGKPKLFFVQACRGDYQDPGVSGHHRVGEMEDGGPQQGSSHSPSKTITSPGVQSIRTTSSLSSAIFSCINGGREREENRFVFNRSITGKGNNEGGASWTFANANVRAPTGAGLPATSPHIPNIGSMGDASAGKMSDKIKHPTEADMLIAYATTPNHVSWRHNLNGTWFIQSICEVFSKDARNEDILTMMTRVNKRVAQVYESSVGKMKQIPEVASRLRRKFYFFPGVDVE